MDIYIFKHNQSKNKATELITMTHNTNTYTEQKEIGDMYNLVDYIISNSFDNSHLTFKNFKENQINFIKSILAKYKEVVTVGDSITIIVSDKKTKARGR